MKEMLIDFHTHAFPEKIAVRAIGKLAHGAWELQLLRSLNLSDSDREKICFRNAQTLLSL